MSELNAVLFFSIPNITRNNLRIMMPIDERCGWLQIRLPDGYTASGVPCSDGTYYYIFKITSPTSKDVSSKGFVSLMRKK